MKVYQILTTVAYGDAVSNDCLAIILSGRHIFKHDAVLETLVVSQSVAHTKRVVKPGTEPIVTEVIFIINIVTILTTVLVGYGDTKHI